MKVLIIGGGGREHALTQVYSKSKKVKKVFVASGNGLIDYENEKVTISPSVKVLDSNGVIKLVRREKIDLVDVAQDEPLAAGFVDKLKKAGIATFGPTQRAAEIEWNKAWARDFMAKYKLPIPTFKTFNNQKEAVAYIKKLPDQVLYVKATGLAAGKGAIRAENKEQTIKAIITMKQFGKSGEAFLIEEAMVGEEFSLFAICDGKNYKVVSWAQDHKTIFDGDKGPNTGGVGSVAPAGVLNTSIVRIIEVKILKPFMEGMRKEGRPYSGILYLGGMLTNNGVKVVEFNARWGDPEAEVILPAIKSDYHSVIKAVLSGKLSQLKIDLDQKVRVSIAGCSRGYPGDYSQVRGKEIFGLTQAVKLPGITIFGAGIKRRGKRFFADGGRVFHLVAEGRDILEARRKAYEAISLISIEGDNLHYRTDIGWRDVERLRKAS